MIGFFSKITNKLFGRHLEFRVRLFNILAATAGTSSVALAIPHLIYDKTNNMGLLCLAAALLSYAILWYVTVSGKYQFGYIFTICVIFLGLIPIFYFNVAYRIPTIIIFFTPVLFVVFMLKGKLMIFFTALVITVYAAIILYDYLFMPMPNYDKGLTLNMLLNFLSVVSVLSVALALHFRLYDKQHKELVEANKKVEEYAKLKQDLVAEMSHELRTPLAVLSSYAQYSVEQIQKNGTNEKTLGRLNIISEEAHRLAELADGALDLLKTTHANDNNGNAKRETINIGTLAKKVVAIQKPISQKIGIGIQTNIDDDAPQIYGNANELTQLIWNVLQNAIIHSGGDRVNIDVKKCGNNGVTLQITDNGCGIAPDIEDKIFERGVSGICGRSGLGLPISREIAEKHGGHVEVVSQQNSGTCVIITLRGLNNCDANETAMA